MSAPKLPVWITWGPCPPSQRSRVQAPEIERQLLAFEQELLKAVGPHPEGEPTYVSHTTKDGWTVTVHLGDGRQFRLPWTEVLRAAQLIVEGSPE